MPLTLTEWDQRFHQQAAWTSDLRSYLYPKIGLKTARRVLDIGCGTGALTTELSAHMQGEIFGADLDLPRLTLAMRNNSRGIFLGADVLTLPFQADVFDITLCHFFLLWVDDPVGAVREMRRVTAPGGMILALAEPDYGGRLDHPPALSRLKDLQTRSLLRQGADPHLGRKLQSIFSQAGCSQITTGVINGQWQQPPSPQEQAQEWKVIANDANAIEDGADTITPTELRELQAIDKLAWEKNERTLYVPTFYAWGKA